MEDAGNFKDVIIVATHNWLWLAGALGLGVIVGWTTCRPDPARRGSVSAK